MHPPECFCWTRFGTEAGQTIESIWARKEEERIANRGVFYWGIGNAIGPSLRRLLEAVPAPMLLFSPILSPPRKEDVAPGKVVAWTEAEALDGSRYQLPECCLVTSSSKPTSPRATHYALVCRSDAPIMDRGSLATLNFSALTNLVTGHPLGSSQTTAVVKRQSLPANEGRKYRVAMSATLVWPYLVRLREPIELAGGNPCEDWQSRVSATWAKKHRTNGLVPQRLPWADQGRDPV